MDNQKQVTTLPTEESSTLVDRVITLPPVIKVPLCLARDPALSPWDWRILTALLIFTNDKGCAWPSRKTLAAALGLPEGDWPSQFYDRLKRVTKRQPNGITSYHIAPDPDGRCAWMSNAACRYHLDSRGWRILTGLMYVCLSDALAADPNHAPQGPLEIGPYHYQRILKAAGFDKNRFQRRYLYHALDQFGQHGWLKPGDYPDGHFLQLPNPIKRVSVGISQNSGVHETGKSVHETGQGTEFEPSSKIFLTYIGTESRPGSRPKQIEKRTGKKQEGGLTQGQRQPDSDSTATPGNQASYLKQVEEELRQLMGQRVGNHADDSKDGFQGEDLPTAAVNPNAVVTERQKQLAAQLAALNIPAEQLNRYLN